MTIWQVCSKPPSMVFPVISARPGARPVMIPSLFTVATLSSLLVHSMLLLVALVGYTAYLNWRFSPFFTATSSSSIRSSFTWISPTTFTCTSNEEASVTPGVWYVPFTIWLVTSWPLKSTFAISTFSSGFTLKTADSFSWTYRLEPSFTFEPACGVPEARRET